MSKILDDRAIVFHARRDPTKCSEGREKHEFTGWREFDGGRGGETVCKHCGVGAMSYTLAMEMDHG